MRISQRQSSTLEFFEGTGSRELVREQAERTGRQAVQWLFTRKAFKEQAERGVNYPFEPCPSSLSSSCDCFVIVNFVYSLTALFA